MHGIEEIMIDGEVVALLLRDDFDDKGVTFFTPGEFSQQVAYMRHPEGHEIAAHRHLLHERQIFLTNEVLFIKSGRLRVDLYGNHDYVVTSRELGPGDVILLISGGHGFEVLEELRMVEVKQGPYAGDGDKLVFEPQPPPFS